MISAGPTENRSSRGDHNFFLKFLLSTTTTTTTTTTITTTKMSSPILGNRSRAAIKERLDELEKQFLNLRSGLLEDLKVEIRGGGGAV